MLKRKRKPEAFKEGQSWAGGVADISNSDTKGRWTTSKDLI